MRRGGSEKQIHNPTRKDETMSANTPDQLHCTTTAGVPPAPPEAHQKAGVSQWSSADLWILARAEAIVERRDFSMMKPSANIAAIAKYIEQEGYEVTIGSDAIHVADPVHSSRAGRLVQTGYQDVTLRSMADARRFVMARS
jgi:hypothetical protein